MIEDGISDQELYKIYVFLDILMYSECWRILNIIFRELTILIDKSWNIHILLSYATASLAGGSKIPNRKAFLDKCKEIYPKESLWVGLD